MFMDVNDEQNEFYSLLGQCIAQWSHVEDGLFSAYFVAVTQSTDGLRITNLPAQAAFYAIQSPDAKIRVTNAAVRFRLLSGMSSAKDGPKCKLLALWDRMYKRTNHKKGRRNQLAHFQVLHTAENKPGRRLELRPALFNLNAAMSPPKPLHCAELEAIRRSFGKLSFDLSTFSYGLAKQLVPPSGSCDSALREGTKVV
jgi:hypothetical protein